MKHRSIIALAVAILIPAGVIAFILSPSAIRWTIDGLFGLQRLPGGTMTFVFVALALSFIAIGLVAARSRKKTTETDPPGA